MAQVTIAQAGIAEKLFRMGYVDLVSVERGGKRPALLHAAAWKGYSWNEDVNVLFAGRMDRDGANIGLRASKYPGLDIDSDHEGLTDLVLGVAGSALPILQAPVRLSRGSRRLFMFRTVEPFKKKKLTVKIKDELHAIEFLADGQQYVIHGLHPSGSKYRFAKHAKLPSHPAELPTITEQMVDAFLEALQVVLEAQGIECTMASAPAGHANPLPDEIVETERSDRLTQMGGAMRRQGGDYDSILVALQSINDTRCSPPLEPHEVESVARSVMRYEANPDELRPKPADVFTVHESEDSWTRHSLGSLRALKIPKQKWIVPGLIPRMKSSLLLAKPKVGKSTFARALTAAMINGQEFLGHQMEEAKVMYLVFGTEGDESELQETFIDRLQAIMPDAEDHPNFRLLIDPPWDWTQAQHIAFIVKEIEAFTPTLVIVDTLDGLAPTEDVNAYAKAKVAMAPIVNIQQKYPVHFMYLHHESKGIRDEYFSPVDAALGSTKWAASVDSVLRIHREEDEEGMRFLSARGRRRIELLPHVLEMDSDTEEVRLGPKSTSYRQGLLHNEIMAVLADGPLSGNAIASEVGRKKKDVGKAARVLESQGAIKGVGSGPGHKWELVNAHDVFEPEEVSGAGD